MEAEIVSPLVAVGTGVLGLLGARRQASHPDQATAGRQVAAVGGVVAGGVSSVIRTTGTIATGVVAGANEMSAALGSATLRVAGRLSSEAVASVVGVATAATATTAGLVVDGAATVAEAVTAPLRRPARALEPVAKLPGANGKRPAGRRPAQSRTRPPRR